MFRTLLLLLTMSITVSANYAQAVKYYNAGKYQQAIQAIKSSKKQYSSPKLHYLWGQSAQKLGRLNEAMSAYERVLLLDEKNIQAQQALNNIYKQTKRENLIDSNHEKVLYMRGGKPSFKERGTSSFLARASLSFGYDSNLDATPDSDTLQDYFGNSVNAKKTSSSFFRFTTLFTLFDDFNTKDGWYAKYILRTYLQDNIDAHFYNLKTASVEYGLGYATQNYNIYMPLSYHRVHYLEKDLLSQYRFNPQIFISIGKNIILDINLLYSENNYFDKEDKIRDDRTYAIESGAYYLFDKNHISGHLKYENRSSNSTFPSKYIGADFWTFKLGSKYYFHPEFLGILHYRFRYGQYDDTVGATVTTRDDNFHQLDTKLLYLWSKQSSVYLSNAYTENRSNYPAAVYRKNTIQFGIDYTY